MKKTILRSTYFLLKVQVNKAFYNSVLHRTQGNEDQMFIQISIQIPKF